jgi:hypothetical protein
VFDHNDYWFSAPDGLDYRLVWGRGYYLEAKKLFGFDPKAGANFFVQVGEGDGSILIAGCRVHYAVRSDHPPKNLIVYIPPSERV